MIVIMKIKDLEIKREFKLYSKVQMIEEEVKYCLLFINFQSQFYRIIIEFIIEFIVKFIVELTIIIESFIIII